MQENEVQGQLRIVIEGRSYRAPCKGVDSVGKILQEANVKEEYSGLELLLNTGETLIIPEDAFCHTHFIYTPPRVPKKKQRSERPADKPELVDLGEAEGTEVATPEPFPEGSC